jgi:S1-C subfamily serine protease
MMAAPPAIPAAAPAIALHAAPALSTFDLVTAKSAVEAGLGLKLVELLTSQSGRPLVRIGGFNGVRASTAPDAPLVPAPPEATGLLAAGDIVVGVGGVDITGWPMRRVIEAIKATPREAVALRVRRPGARAALRGVTRTSDEAEFRAQPPGYVAKLILSGGATLLAGP